MLAAALLLLPLSALAALPAGISGAWFNPDQSGHGLGVEMLGGGRALLFWNVFDPEGRPLNLYIEGSVEGRSIQGTAYATQGMRFGEFSSSRFQMRRWGDIRIEFASCREARLHYDANGEAGGSAYGRGSMPLTRLISIANLGCVFPGEASLPVGLYQGVHQLARAPRSRPMRLAVAPDQSVWGVELLQAGSPLLPDGTYFGNFGPLPVIVLRGDRQRADAHSVTLALQVFDNNWQRWPRYESKAQQDMTLAVAPGGQVAGSATFDAGSGVGTLFVEQMPGSAGLTYQLALPDLAGTYRLHLSGQFYELLNADQAMTVEADGRFCIKGWQAAGSCHYVGELSIPFPGYAFVDFELARQGAAGGQDQTRRYHGRGWLERTATGAELVLVGSDGGSGVGLIGTR